MVSEKGTLILSSFGARAPLVAEKLSSVLPARSVLASQHCVIVPLAGFDPRSTGLREKAGLCTLGFSDDHIHIVLEDSDIPKVIPSFIYVPGGDPFALLDAARKRGILSYIDTCVRQHNTTYIGVSAGAYLATEHMDYLTLVEDNNLDVDDLSALGFLKTNVLCHADHYSTVLLKLCESIGGKRIITLNDDELLILGKDRVTKL